MPRKGRVDRAGPYPNRSDLRTTQPVTAPSGLPYGQRQQLEQAQTQVPLPNNPSTQTPGVHPVIAGAQAMQPPEGPLLSGPSTAPHEPLTAGIPLGLGPGPEVLPRFAMGQADSAGTLINQLAARPDAPDEVKYLAQYLASGRR